MNGDGGTSPGIAEPKNVQQAPQMPVNTPIVMTYTITINHCWTCFRTELCASIATQQKS